MFCAFALSPGSTKHVEIPEGMTFRLTGASLKLQDAETAERMVVTLQHCDSDGSPLGEGPCTIALLTSEKPNSLLDLYVSSDVRLGLSSGSTPAECVGSLVPAMHRAKRRRVAPAPPLPAPIFAAASPDLCPYDASKLTPEQALQVYQRDQVLWLRFPKAIEDEPLLDLDDVRALFKDYTRFFAESWTVENPMRHAEEALTPKHVLGAPKIPEGPFYVSSILQENPAAFERSLCAE